MAVVVDEGGPVVLHHVVMVVGHDQQGLGHPVSFMGRAEIQMQGVFFYWSPLKCLSNFFELDPPYSVGGTSKKKHPVFGFLLFP